MLDTCLLEKYEFFCTRFTHVLVCKTEYNLVKPYGFLGRTWGVPAGPPLPTPSPRGPSSAAPSPPQQAFNATAVVRHMRRLQLGTSQEGQGQTASHGELLTPTAGGKNRGHVAGARWSMKRRKAGWSLLHSRLCSFLCTGPAAGCCCRDCCVEPGSELPPAPPPSSRAMD